MVDKFYHWGHNKPSGGDERMGLNLKNPEVEHLAAEVAAMVGETKTEAIRRALEERKEHLRFRVTNRDRKTSLLRLLEGEIWPLVPEGLLGKRLSRKEREQILGYGPEGV
jgi:antitoxin VapB